MSKTSDQVQALANANAPTDSNPVATIVDLPSTAGLVPETRQVNSGTGLNGGGDLSQDRTLNLENTAVTPGAYTLANITIDAQGRITAAANGSAGTPDLSNAEFPDYAVFSALNVTGATNAVDFSVGNKATVDANNNSGNITLASPAGHPGSFMLTILNSGGVGNITPDPLWDSGTPPVWAGTTVLALYYDGTNWYGSAIVGAA